MSTSEAKPASVQAYALLALATLCWSGNQVLGRAVAGHVPPVALSSLRWALPLIVMLPFARPHLARDWPVIRRHWGILAILGLTGGALFSALTYTGLNYTTAINSAVLNSLGPVLIVVVVAIMFRETLRPIQFAGVAVSLAGVLFIVTEGHPATLVEMSFNRGDVIILAAMAVWALYSACLRLRPTLHWMSFITVFAFVTALGALPFAIYEHVQGFRLQPTWTTLLSVAYFSIFPSVVAYLSWNRGVALIGASRAGVLLHLIPVYSALLSGLFLGERLAYHHIVGFVLILAGVTLAARKA